MRSRCEYQRCYSTVRRGAVFCLALVGLIYAVFPETRLTPDPVLSRGVAAERVDWEPHPPSSCAGYFGNGFAAAVELADGGIRCRTNSATRAFLCRARKLMLNPSDITMSRGGETLSAVMGRSEAEELPVFGPRAVRLVDSAAPASSSLNQTLVLKSVEALPREFASLATDDSFKSKLLRAARITSETVSSKVCSVSVDVPTLFVTRMEYVNLYHTSTDWYNSWLAARILGFSPTTDYAADALFGLTPEMRTREAAAPRAAAVPRLPLHVVFLDGHNAGPMDDGWLALFLSINYVKHLPDGVCFTDAVLAPFGYHAPLIAGMEVRGSDCPSEPHVRQFSDDFVAGFGLEPRTTAGCNSAGESAPPPPVLFVRRTHYVVHPRHGGKVVRRLENEDAVLAALAARLAREPRALRVVEGDFARMSMRAQVEAVQGACVIFGAHGAGLTHTFFAPPGVHVLELRPPGFVRPHFIAAARWAGAQHTDWLGSSSPQPDDAVDRIFAAVAAAVAVPATPTPGVESRGAK